MMDPVSIAFALAQFAPAALKWMAGSDKAADVASKVIDIATAVTGKPDGQAALEELKVNPAAVLEFRKAVLDQEVELEKLAKGNADAINATMQAEAGAEHWPSYGWRPAIGFSVAYNIVFTTTVVGIAFTGVILFARDPKLLEHIPAMIFAMTGLIGMAMPVLGIASWFRGKAAADPSIPPIKQLPFRSKD